MNSYEAELLTELHDIAVPPLTQAPVWPWLLLALTVATTLYALLIWARLHIYPWYIPALSQLNDLKQLSPQARSLPLHKLLRQLAMAEQPDSAGLQGEPWVNRLDSILRTRYFSQAEGRILLNGVYCSRQPEVDDKTLQDIQQIIKQRARWPW